MTKKKVHEEWATPSEALEKALTYLAMYDANAVADVRAMLPPLDGADMKPVENPGEEDNGNEDNS